MRRLDKKEARGGEAGDSVCMMKRVRLARPPALVWGCGAAAAHGAAGMHDACGVIQAWNCCVDPSIEMAEHHDIAMKMCNRSRLRFYDRFLVLHVASNESFQGLNPRSLPESSSLCPAEQETRFSAFKRR